MVGAGEKVRRRRRSNEMPVSVALDAEFLRKSPSLCWPSAGGGVSMRGPPCAKVKAASGTPKPPSTPVAAFMAMDDAAGSQAADRRPPRPCVRTRAAGTWRACRNASHSSAVRVSMISLQHGDLARVVGVALVVGLLDHVGPPEQLPQPAPAGADCWRPASPARPWSAKAPLVACGWRLPLGFGCTPLRK